MSFDLSGSSGVISADEGIKRAAGIKKQRTYGHVSKERISALSSRPPPAEDPSHWSAEDVAALRESGVTVDNEDPDEANIAPPPAQPIQGTWGRPAICARKARSSLSDFEGGWKYYAWTAIKEQTYFDTFLVCFPEQA